MRHFRFSIAGLMGAVLVAAVGLAALKNATETWAGAMLLLTCGTLALAVVGAIYRKGVQRAWWLGFSLFGWGYLVLLRCCHEYSLPILPTRIVLEILGPWMSAPRYVNYWGNGPYVDERFALVGQCLWTLVVALLGGMVSAVSFASPRDHPVESRPDAYEMNRPPRSRWLRTTIIGLVVSILIATATTMWSGPGASIWAGITFSLTCPLIGLAILGALFERGRRRQLWLGAALFGAGYMALVFSLPVGRPPRAFLAVDQILKALRPSFSSLPRSIHAANTRILESLERPVPMRFPDETALTDVLKSIKQATSTPTYPGIPIYVDPIGLQEAERSLKSTVEIDLEGVPLKTTLRLCLEQLGLDYDVKDGYLRISSEDLVSIDLEDPFLIVGHCLIALLAAGFGALAVPLVAAARREPVGSRPRPVGDAHPNGESVPE
jgi:hypothetical protein